jgi:hypothetical protein
MADETDDQLSREDDRRDRERAARIGETAIDMGVATLVAAKPEYAGLIAGIGVPGKLVLQRILGVTDRRRRERATYTIVLGTRKANFSIEEFERVCEQNPDLMQLFTKIVSAAQDAVFQAKLNGLALSLANALEDGSRVDEEILFATVLGLLERPHVRLLADFERNPAELAPDEANPEDYIRQAQQSGQQWSYNSGQLAMLDPGLEHVLQPLVAVLLANGLIVRMTEGMGMSFGSLKPEDIGFAITDFGGQVLARLRWHAEPPGDPDAE